MLVIRNIMLVVLQNAIKMIQIHFTAIIKIAIMIYHTSLLLIKIKPNQHQVSLANI